MSGYLLEARFNWQLATRLTVAPETLGSVVIRCLPSGRLRMRIVASNASELPRARAITLTQGHSKVMFNEDGLRRRVPIERHFENSDHLIQGSARPEVLFLFPRLCHPSVSALVTFHTDVI